MLVLALDESSKKAWKRSRRVLARALPRVGTRAFSGRLSQESLRNLVADLKSVASKNTSVVILHSHPHRDAEVVARIGNTRAWSEDGWYAHREVTRKERPTAQGYQPHQRVWRSIIRLAALFHDLGKLNGLFQRKLRDSEVHERYRHEFVSFVMLLQWLETVGRDSRAWLEALSKNPAEGWRASIGRKGVYWSGPMLARPEDSSRYFADISHALVGKGDSWDHLTHALLWLVLTHHRMVGVDRDNCDAPDVLAESRLDLPFYEENINLVPDGRPWDDERWCSSVRDCASELLRVVEAHPRLVAGMVSGDCAWQHTLCHVARPVLVYADYLGSIQKRPSKAEDGVAHANTLVDTSRNRVLADTLTDHLLKVRRAVDPVFRLAELQAGCMPFIDTEALPADSLLRQTNASSRFRWQQEAVDAVAKHPDAHQAPFFAMVVSGTGAGKTLGGAKLMACASGGRLRYTAALGLRSLTLQTGSVYTRRALLPEDKVLTVVGDAIYARLQSSSREQIALPSGSECLEGMELVLDKDPAPEKLCQLLGVDKQNIETLFRDRKGLAMTESPVLVCTVDHLMAASVLKRGGDSRMALRQMTADLLLDEIDNYSDEDLVALGRLVHQAGVYGRRVVLMSATVQHVVLEELYRAWLTGIEAWRARTTQSVSVMLALVSDTVSPLILRGQGHDDCGPAVRDYLASMCAATPPAEARNIAAVATLSDDLDGTMRSIAQRGLSLAEVHRTVCSTTGRTFSAGAFRFNHVRNARTMAQTLYALDVPPSTAVLVQCYHRRMPLLHLTVVERSLNALLSRTDDQAVFSHAAVQRAFSVGGVRHVVLLVATTSISETGRDHDYDWMVTEPWSNRSFVQMAGRVRRHRSGRVQTPNVVVLENELATLPGQEVRYPLELSRTRYRAFLTPAEFAKGIEHTVRGGRVVSSGPLSDMFPAGTSAPSEHARWLDLSSYERGVTPAPCLLGGVDHGLLSALEKAVLQGRLSESQSRYSLRNIVTTPGMLLSAAHARAVVFRRQDSEQVTLTFSPESGYKQLCVLAYGVRGLTLHPCANGPASSWATTVRNRERAFVPLDRLDQGAVETELKGAGIAIEGMWLRALSFSVYSTLAAAMSGNTNLDYDALLGADVVSVQSKH